VLLLQAASRGQSPKENCSRRGCNTAGDPKPDRLLEMSDMVRRRLKTLGEQFCKVRPLAAVMPNTKS